MLQLESMESLAETCRTGLPRGVDVCGKLGQLPLNMESSCGSMCWWLLQSGFSIVRIYVVFGLLRLMGGQMSDAE